MPGGDHRLRVPSGQPGRLYVLLAAQSFSTAPSEEAVALTSLRPLLVTVEHAGKILCLSRSSIYQLIWHEELVPIRIGRRVRFSVEQLERFVTERHTDLTG